MSLPSDREPAFGRADLTNCDREPIHVPGAIQPHGALLALDPQALTVVQIAGDTRGLLGYEGDALLTQSFDALFGPDHLCALREILAHGDLSRPLHVLDPALRLGTIPLDVSVHRASDGMIVIECEAAPDRMNERDTDPLSAVQRMLSSVQAAPDLQGFCQAASEQVRRVTGYDRVMIYRFLPEGDGWVFAESHADGMDPYLELRYPATDIPKQARDLYLKNWLRIITDVDYCPAPLLPALNSSTGRTLDMSQCTLRSVSPIHLEYLRNMGVAATMTISLIRGGKLWGLIACHNTTPKPIPRHVRAICELFGHMVSFQLESREQAEIYEYRAKLRQVHERLVRHMAGEGDLAEALFRQQPNLLDYIDAGGVALVVEGRFSSLGRAPCESHVRALVDWLDRTHPDEGVFATASVAADWDLAADFAAEASGVLALAASRSPRDYVLWFRPEVIETVRWAGDPKKPVEVADREERISPRRSFAAWVQKVRQHAKPWTDAEIEAAQMLRLSLLEVILKRIDQVAREREAAHARHVVMLAELNHRVKNTLATIQALARHSRKSAPSLDAYVQSFEQRIHAMAASHNLLTDTGWETVDLQTLAEEQLRPYAGGEHTVIFDGPQVSLQPKAATALGMALHELATNAAKYGALSTPAGRVSIQWSVVGGAPSRVLFLNWREAGGPPVQPPTRQGFGSFVVQRFITHETQGTSAVRFDPDGVRWEAQVPESALNLPPDNWGAGSIQAEEAGAGDKVRVLVVEDEALVAFAVEEAVRSLGWTPVGPAARVEAAVTLARTQVDLQAAVLDINLDGAPVWPVAEVLQERGVPFLFATGYDRMRATMPSRFAKVPVLGKPLMERQLVEALRGLASGAVTAQGTG